MSQSDYDPELEPDQQSEDKFQYLTYEEQRALAHLRGSWIFLGLIMLVALVSGRPEESALLTPGVFILAIGIVLAIELWYIPSTCRNAKQRFINENKSVNKIELIDSSDEDDRDNDHYTDHLTLDDLINEDW